jgi:hypothetical protein
VLGFGRAHFAAPRMKILRGTARVELVTQAALLMQLRLLMAAIRAWQETLKALFGI